MATPPLLFNNWFIIDMNPWQSNDNAFDVMFTEQVGFDILDGSHFDLYCCVFPNETVDPFADSDNISTIMTVTVLVRCKDWLRQSNNPSVGDQMTLENGDKYKVATIKKEQNWYKLEGRICV